LRPRPAAIALAALTASAATALGASASTASPPASASAARAATVRVAKTSVGRILVNSAGFTLYMFSADHRNQDHCVKVSGCTGVWPPLTVTSRPTAGSGVKGSLLGTINIGRGKRRQVTYAGHPLYHYSGDSSPGATGYIGFREFGGNWYGETPAGSTVK
jgi:predicted lipoprotein with Yx(FWY)xxD motif